MLEWDVAIAQWKCPTALSPFPLLRVLRRQQGSGGEGVEDEGDSSKRGECGGHGRKRGIKKGGEGKKRENLERHVGMLTCDPDTHGLCSQVNALNMRK